MFEVIFITISCLAVKSCMLTENWLSAERTYLAIYKQSGKEPVAIINTFDACIRLTGSDWVSLFMFFQTAEINNHIAMISYLVYLCKDLYS